MRFPNLIGGAYSLSSLKADCQNCVNLYPEINEAKTAKDGEIGRLVLSPGLTLLATIGTGPIRGVYYTSTGALGVVSGNKVYSVNSSWVAKEVGTLLTNTGLVDITDNGKQVFIVDGSNGYIISMITEKFERVVSSEFIPGTRNAFNDGYFTSQNPGTGQFQISSLYDGLTWNGLDFGNAEGNPDPIISHVVVNRQIWLFGSRSTEVYWNSGASDFPFTRIDGSYIEYGCGSAWSACRFGGSVAWLTDAGVVMMANGFSPQRISNHSVELEIRKMGDFSSAYAWSYQTDGHYFYCLNLGDNQSTWVYDLATGLWHERTRYDNGILKRHRANCYTYAYNTHVVGDFENGNIYSLDPNARTDNGAVITRVRTSPHLSNSINRMFLQKFQLDFQPGVGISNGQGSDPQVMLQISYDGGYTWGTERWATIGKIGQTKARAIWRRLGQGRDIVVRIKYTDPTDYTILGADIDVELGAN